MDGVNSNMNSCERVRIDGAAWIDADFARFETCKIFQKKGAYFKGNEKECQSAFGVGGRSPTETKFRQGEKMYQFKLLVAMGVFVMAISVGCLTGCKTHSEKITSPDGTIREIKDVEFLPNFNPLLFTYDVKDVGVTEEGLIVREWTPTNGGVTVWEVEGNFYGVKVIVRAPILSRNNSQTEANLDEVESFQASEYRISADYLADSAVLEGQIVGTNNWQVIVSGDLETVAIAAMRRNLGVLEFENEFGAWSIHVDSPIPVIITRLNGEILNVRGVGASMKPKLDTTLNERCR